jgi:IS30 family transposase
MKWTPEQIAGRAKLEKYHTTFSFVTIYRAIAHRVLPISLHREMRFKSKHKSHKPYDKRGKIQDIISIRERPSFVENRKSIGHWESDTVLGQRKIGVIGTHVEDHVPSSVEIRKS